MPLIVLTGGVRSGKSRFAVELATELDIPVTFIATAEAGDDEMRVRIQRHQAERPASWNTIEEPLDLIGEIQSVDNDGIVVDCLTLWLSNLLRSGHSDQQVLDEAAATAGVAAEARATVIAVTNEVGAGVHPPTALGRRFADLLGSVNQIWAARADRVALLVAGRVLWLPEA